MTDFLLLFLLWLGLALFLAAASGDPMKYLRDEWARIRARTWAPRVTGTAADPRVERLATKQRALAKRMRREGRHLLSGRAYVPELTKPVVDPPRAPKADKVVPIRRTA